MKLEHETDFLVAEGSQLGVIQFADLSAIDDELSAVGLVKCADDVEQGGLACAGSTNDTHNFAFGDMEVDAFEHFEAAVGFMNACRLDHTLSIWLQKYEILCIFAVFAKRYRL